MPRHRVPISTGEGVLPDWVIRETNDCLRSVAEETYTARSLAVNVYRAMEFPSCSEIVKAGDKSLVSMNDTSLSSRVRCNAGERAMRKYWEAKVCARRYVLRRGWL